MTVFQWPGLALSLSYFCSPICPSLASVLCSVYFHLSFYFRAGYFLGLSAGFFVVVLCYFYSLTCQLPRSLLLSLCCNNCFFLCIIRSTCITKSRRGKKKIETCKLGVVVHAFNPSTRREAEASRPLRGQPGLHCTFQVNQSYTVRPFLEQDPSPPPPKKRKKLFLGPNITKGKSWCLLADWLSEPEQPRLYSRRRGIDLTQMCTQMCKDPTSVLALVTGSSLWDQ